MPISYVDLPEGIQIDTKRKMVKEICAALEDAYRIPDTRIFLREWPLDAVSQDGRLDLKPAKPVVFLEVPPGIQAEAKRHLLKRISAAVTEAYHLPDVLIFFREYALDMVSQDGGLQSENPLILEAMKKAASF